MRAGRMKLLVAVAGVSRYQPSTKITKMCSRKARGTLPKRE